MKTKRKNIVILLIYLFYICLINYELYSQTYDSTPLDRQELERYYDQYDNLKYDKDYPGSTDNFAYVGKNATSSETKNTFRMIYTWVHSIPATAIITSCTLSIAQTVTSTAPADDPSYVEFQFKEFPNNKYSSSASEQWAAINTSNVLRTEQIPRSPGNYYTSFIMDQTFLTYIKNTLSTGKIHLAFRATDEEIFGTDRNIHLVDFKKTPTYNVLSALRIVVTYAVPVNMTVQNNFPGGTIFADYEEKASPFYPFAKLTETRATLMAKEQNDNLGYSRIWNDTEAPNSKSRWEKNGLDAGSSIEKSFIVAQNDDGATYEAGLRKNFRIDQKHKFEFGSDILQSNPGYIVEQNSGSITAPLTSTSGNKTGNFSFWTDGITARTRNVTLPNDNLTYTAFYKLNNYASSTNSYDKDGPKKSLMPWAAYDSGNWKVYESSGQIWLEKNGVVVNGGLPVNNLSDGPEAKSPAMDYVVLSNWYSDIFVVYQQKTLNGKYKIKLAKFNGYGQKIYTYDVLTSTIDYNTFDAAPVISVTRNPDQASGKTKFNIVWCQKSEGSYQNGLYFYSGMDNGTNITWYYYPAKVSSTDASSSNPTMTVFKSPKGTAFLYHLAWQQGTTKIKYRAIADNWNGSTTGGVLENGSIEEPSYGDGWETNIEPSIAVLNNGTGISYGVYSYDSPKLVWKSDYAVTHRSKTTSSWGAFYNYYANDDISAANISAAIEEQTYVITWAELVGYYNRYIKSTNLSSQIAMGTHGKDIQVSNYGSFEWGFDINVFNNMTGTSAPFSFQTFSVQDGLSKANNFIAKEGRFGTVMKNEAEFYFGMGDLIANNNLVSFVELNDTLVITTNDLLNTYLLTEPFEVNDNGSFTYSIIYGVKDSLSAFTNLSSTENISFKVELIDNISNDVLGVFDQVVQSKNNLVAYENLSYQVNTTGIGNRTVRVRLVINPNFSNTNYSLSKIFSDGAPLSKSKINEVNWRGLNTVDSYDLEQNFPNPFNPSTTIRYQIPQDGIVTLKIYDILGSEVATLVNEEKVVGKYEVNFNASALASGVYIYKIQAGTFNNSKKMILLK